MKEDITELRQMYYSYIDEELSLDAFERFIYINEWIRDIIGDEDYLELISLNYNSRDIKYRLGDVLLPHIGWADYQKQNILKDLHRALLLDKELPNILRRFYDLYCGGYFFFEDLGLGYGLSCQCPTIDGRTYDSWEDLDEEQRERMVASFLPNLTDDIRRAICWIEGGKIVLLNIRNELDQMEFEDRRTEEEKKSTVWKVVSEDTKTGARVSKSNIEIKKKPWWRKK